jgi:hypothetical protein
MASETPKPTIADVVKRLDIIETQIRLTRFALLQLNQATPIELTVDMEETLKLLPKLPWTLAC